MGSEDRAEECSCQGTSVGLCRLAGLAHRGPAGRRRQLRERLAGPGPPALLAGHADEGGLAGGLAAEGQVEVELEAVDLGQALAFEARLAGEVEEGAGVGEEGLDAAPLGARQEGQGRGEVAEEVAADLGADRRGALVIEALAAGEAVDLDARVLAAGAGIGAPIAGAAAFRGLLGCRQPLLRPAGAAARAAARPP
jgi:hypothetical protein